MASVSPMDRPRAASHSRWRLLRLGFLVLVVALLASVIYWIERHTVVSQARISRQTLILAKVSEGLFRDTMPIRGRVTALHTVFLDAQAGGRVENVLVQAGDEVAAGQVLAQLSNSQWQMEVLEREARLVESVSQLESYQTTLEQNRINNERALALIDYDVTRLRRSLGRRTNLAALSEPAEKIDQIKDELEYDLKIQPLQLESNHRQEQLRGEQVPQIRDQLKALAQDLALTRAQLQKLEVRAPIGGRLTSFDLQVGESHATGDRFGEIVPGEGFKLSASVDEYYLKRVTTGQRAAVIVRGRSFEVQASRVFPKVKDGVFTVDFAFIGEKPPDLVPGEHVEGVLTLAGAQRALVLDAGPFLEQTSGRWAFVVASDGRTAERRNFSVGRRSHEQLEILSGLRAGDQVVISSYASLTQIEQLQFIP
jgi:HlyD family secretion protein